MASTSTVPVMITPEAQARVNELGRQAELARMIEHILETAPQLVSVEADAFIRCDEDSPPGVCVTAMTARNWEEVVKNQHELSLWKITTFPPEVCEHFVLAYGFMEAPHAG